MSRRRQQRATSTEGIVSSFLDRWEHEWDKSEEFNSSQRQAIKLYLSKILIQRLDSTLKLAFTSAELDAAIGSVKNTEDTAQSSMRYVHKDDWPDKQCAEFVDLFFRNQVTCIDFSKSDLDRLWAKLYIGALERYKARRYMCLSITRKEFHQALSLVERVRQKRAIEAENELRDEEIRAKRRAFNAHECVLHPFSD